MKILYIDTTSSCLYSAISEDGKITGEIKEDLGKDLSVFTLDKIKSMLDANNISINTIDKFIVVNGPGSFTGIRIGVTISKVLALMLNKKISTISSLQAMALSSTEDTSYKVPLIDARRGYVYSGIYDKDNNIILKDQYIKLDTLKCIIEQLPGNYIIITNNNIEIPNKEKYSPNFEKILNVAIDIESVNPHYVNPIYLKSTEAEEKQEVEVLW